MSASGRPAYATNPGYTGIIAVCAALFENKDGHASVHGASSAGPHALSLDNHDCEVPLAPNLALRPRLRLREPFSGLSHLLGAILGVAALVTLVVLARGRAWLITSFSIYGASLILLYSTSAIYHLFPIRQKVVDLWLKLDQCAIYLLIAGCYTPLCIGRLRGGWGWSLFGAVWGLAVVGIGLKAAWRAMPTWCDMLLYLLMGWLVVIGVGPISHVLGGAGVRWLLASGILYSAGSVFYVTDRPRLWPGLFSAHDIWHLFVLAGSAAYFMVMLALLRT